MRYVKGVQKAYERPAFSNARYAVFHTARPATGDIEGVLIHERREYGLQPQFSRTIPGVVR